MQRTTDGLDERVTELESQIDILKSMSSNDDGSPGIFDMIQEIEYLSIVPDPSVEADASIIFVEDVMLNCLLEVVVRHQGGVIAWHSDAGVA